jgi:hypothetical protein
MARRGLRRTVEDLEAAPEQLQEIVTDLGRVETEKS